MLSRSLGARSWRAEIVSYAATVSRLSSFLGCCRVNEHSYASNNPAETSLTHQWYPFSTQMRIVSRQLVGVLAMVVAVVIGNTSPRKHNTGARD